MVNGRYLVLPVLLFSLLTNAALAEQQEQFDFVVQCHYGETLKVFALSNGTTLFAAFNTQTDVTGFDPTASYISPRRTVSDFAYDFAPAASYLVQDGLVDPPAKISLYRTNLTLSVKDAIGNFTWKFACTKVTDTADAAHEYANILSQVDAIKEKRRQEIMIERQQQLNDRKL